jgi:hypothetical protein
VHRDRLHTASKEPLHVGKVRVRLLRYMPFCFSLRLHGICRLFALHRSCSGSSPGSQ